MGTGLRFRARAVASNVPSPPSTISKSTLDGHLVAGQAALFRLHDGAGFLVNKRLDAAFTEPFEQAGTISRISVFFGLEMMPTRLMGIANHILQWIVDQWLVVHTSGLMKLPGPQ